MFIPYDVDIRIRHWPYANIGIMVICGLVYLLMVMHVGSEEFWGSLVLQGFHPLQLITSLFLHGGFFHLLFNMLYLWVFGNAICSKLGSWRYCSVYLLGGMAAGVVHLLVDGHPAIGASGAIYAVIGFYLVLYPTNQVNCFWLFFFRGGSVGIAGFWLILLWFALDAWNALAGASGGIAYWAHIGGFLAGLAMGGWFLLLDWTSLEHDDHPSLLQCLGIQPARQADNEADPFLNRSPQPAAGPPTPRPRVIFPPPVIPTGFPDCPGCGVRLEIDADLAGEQVVCPSCRQPLIIAGDSAKPEKGSGQANPAE